MERKKGSGNHIHSVHHGAMVNICDEPFGGHIFFSADFGHHHFATVHATCSRPVYAACLMPPCSEVISTILSGMERKIQPTTVP